MTNIACPPRWHHAVDADDWLAQALDYVLAAEAGALRQRGVFHIVLAGGSTPARLYRALAGLERDWARWQVWFGDERCLPPDHPERNSRLAAEAWLDRLATPPGAIHVIPAESGPAQAAQDYATRLAGVPAFDLVLLGLGEDGHTASLFPRHDLGESADSPDVLPVYDAPKPPPERVSLSARRLSRARRVLFLVTGAGKRAALAAWRAGQSIPAAAVRPPGGVDVLLDHEAGGNEP